MTIKTKTPQTRMDRRVVKGLREALGISVAELAKRANVPMAKLYAWEQGRRKLPFDELCRMVNTLSEIQVRDWPDALTKLQSASIETGGMYAKDYRTMHGITQAEVAAEMKMSQTDVSLYEKGYLTLTEKELKRLTVALDRLREKHSLVANEMRLFREIEASLRRELAEKEAQLGGGNQAAIEGGMMKLSSLRGKRGDEE